MKAQLFRLPDGSIIVKPLPNPGENYTALVALIASVSGRRWHPRERQWTVPQNGYGTQAFLRRLIEGGFVDPIAETDSDFEPFTWVPAPAPRAVKVGRRHRLPVPPAVDEQQTSPVSRRTIR